MPNGRGRNQGNKPGRGRGAGQPGMCVCPECGTSVSHKRGIPCVQTNCPNCGAKMMRKG